MSAEGGASIPADVLSGLGLSLLETPQPEFTIQTSDKYWVGYTGRFDIVCVSSNSDTDVVTPGRQNSITIDSFTINVVDECATTMISPAERGDYTTFIYSVAEMPFSFGSQNLDCAAPTYSIDLLSSTSLDPTNCYIDESLNIVMDADELNDAGTY